MNGDTVDSTTTDTDGEYRFEELPVGEYVVAVEAPTGQTFVLADQGDDDTRDSDVSPATGRVTVHAYGPVPNVDAGFVAAPLDLAVTMTQSNASPKVSDPLDYTLRVTNSGDTSSLGTITLVHRAPAGVVVESVEAGAGWTCAVQDHTTTCAWVGVLAPGAATTDVVVRTTVASVSAPLVASADVASAGVESSTGNNSASTTANNVAATTTTIARGSSNPSR
ncbi:MAG: SdrD B-like domain-containing protein [Ilumatobacteraceae bacterium]